MKKSLLSLLSFLLIFSIQDGLTQTIVSTTPENKNAVLEEFTGIYCTFCPDGHKLAQELKDANPGKVVLVNIHTGGYAAPNGNDPDFRTAWGSAIASQSNLSGYPAGTVNRHQFSMTQNGGTAMSRGDWASAASQEFTVGSPVNVAATATWDVSTNQISVYVEAYYTGNSNASTNKLNVAILENNVKGPQTGGTTYNPNNFDSDGNYLHKHMLRNFLTGQWGADITTTTTGSFYSNTFTYTIPADYNGIVPNVPEMEVAVYIAEGQQEILTGVDVPITATNISTTNNSSIVSVSDLGAYCGYSAAPQVKIRNMGADNLTSLEISYNINGGPNSTYQWSGNLAFYENEVVTLPVLAFTPAGTNTINVSTTNPNSSIDDDPFNDSGSSSFTDAPKATSTTIDFQLVTDQYGSETSWEVTDDLGTILYSASAGTYPDVAATYNETWSIPNNGCYTFTINDSYGDGIFPGSYRLTSNTVIIINGGSFSSIEDKPFEETAGAIPPLVGITSSTGSNSNTNCDGTATVTPSGGTGPYTFLWDDANSQTTMTATGLCPGDYFPIVYDNNNSFIMPTVTVDDISVPPLSILNGIQLGNFEIAPNPFENSTVVAFTLIQTQNVAISILNLLGEEVVKVGEKLYEPGNYKEAIYASSLPSGIYFVDVKVDGVSNLKKVTHTK